MKNDLIYSVLISSNGGYQNYLPLVHGFKTKAKSQKALEREIKKYINFKRTEFGENPIDWDNTEILSINKYIED